MEATNLKAVEGSVAAQQSGSHTGCVELAATGLVTMTPNQAIRLAQQLMAHAKEAAEN